ATSLSVDHRAGLVGGVLADPQCVAGQPPGRCQPQWRAVAQPVCGWPGVRSELSALRLPAHGPVPAAVPAPPVADALAQTAAARGGWAQCVRHAVYCGGRVTVLG